MKQLVAITVLSLCICLCIAQQCPSCDPSGCAIPSCSSESVLKKKHPCDCCLSCYTEKQKGEDCSSISAACADGSFCINGICQ
ncbi:unnamed protein product [Diabrotica balteata]|uniref:Uncharacterized protein n=1 Tax=Diabrotica balteata TaxID=107213 RepID=A0A9N9XDL9_DIABA|nr:unnamed protein product [Diabrotica balteata]